MKKRFILEIEVDEENIANKYPNYQCNYEDADEFVEGLITDIVYDADTNTDKDGIEQWGYAKRIISEINNASADEDAQDAKWGKLKV